MTRLKTSVLAIAVLALSLATVTLFVAAPAQAACSGVFCVVDWHDCTGACQQDCTTNTCLTACMRLCKEEYMQCAIDYCSPDGEGWPPEV